MTSTLIPNTSEAQKGCVPFSKSKNGFLILDLPDFATETQEREIPNGIITLVTFRVKSVTASQERMYYLLFDELCDDTMNNFVIGYSNSGVGAECINRERSEFRLNLCRGIYPLIVCPVSYSVKTRILCKIEFTRSKIGIWICRKGQALKKSGEQSIAINKHKRL